MKDFKRQENFHCGYPNDCGYSNERKMNSTVRGFATEAEQYRNTEIMEANPSSCKEPLSYFTENNNVSQEYGQQHYQHYSHTEDEFLKKLESFLKQDEKHNDELEGMFSQSITNKANLEADAKFIKEMNYRADNNSNLEVDENDFTKSDISDTEDYIEEMYDLYVKNTQPYFMDFDEDNFIGDEMEDHTNNQILCDNNYNSKCDENMRNTSMSNPIEQDNQKEKEINEEVFYNQEPESELRNKTNQNNCMKSGSQPKQQSEVSSMSITEVVKFNFQKERPMPTQLSSSDVKSILMNIPSLNVWGKIKGFWLNFLVDTGATITAISWEVWDKLEKRELTQLRREHHGRVLTANGSNLHVLGIVTLPFEINNQVYKFRAYVVQGLSQKVILGKDFLVYYNGIINLKRGDLTLEIDSAEPTEKIPKLQKDNKPVERTHQVLAKKRYKLPPRLMTIYQYPITFPTEEDYVFEPDQSLLEEKRNLHI